MNCLDRKQALILHADLISHKFSIYVPTVQRTRHFEVTLGVICEMQNTTSDFPVCSASLTFTLWNCTYYPDISIFTWVKTPLGFPTASVNALLVMAFGTLQVIYIQSPCRDDGITHRCLTASPWLCSQTNRWSGGLEWEKVGRLQRGGHMLLIAKLQKRTYTNNSLQFPAEMKTSGSKTPTAFISFHTNYD